MFFLLILEAINYYYYNKSTMFGKPCDPLKYFYLISLLADRGGVLAGTRRWPTWITARCRARPPTRWARSWRPASSRWWLRVSVYFC